MKPTQKEKILFIFLGFIFIAHILLYYDAMNYCKKHGGLTACPKIADRGEVMLSTMTATVLALFTGIHLR